MEEITRTVRITFRERSVLEQRYFFGVAMTYKQIADKWNVTPERIKQVHDKAVKRIMRALLLHEPEVPKLKK